jgi:fatty-acyl-CoA synthase
MDTKTYSEFSTNYPLLLTTFMKRPVRYYPDQIGVVYRNHVTGEYQRFTWREWYERVCQLAHALQDEIKIQPGKPGQLGDRVGTMAYNTHRHLELYYAVPCTGATLHPINIRLSEEHIVYTINHAQDTVIFVDDVVMPLLENIYDRIKDTVKLFVYMSDKPGLPETKIPNRPLKKCSSNAPGSWISKKRIAQTGLRSDWSGHFGLFAGRFARSGRTYPMVHA